MEKCAEIKALWTKIVTVLFLCMWSPCIVNVTSNRPKASKIYDSQMCSTAPFTNTSEIQWHKMAITRVEQFLKSGISYHCKEKRRPVSTMLSWVWGTLRILSKLISKLNQNQICANNCNLSSGPYLTKVLRYRIAILDTKSLTSIHLPLLFAFFNELRDEERSLGKSTWFGAFFLPKWNFDQ